MGNVLRIQQEGTTLQLGWQRGQEMMRSAPSVPFQHPFNQEALDQLRWYLENFLHIQILTTDLEHNQELIRLDIRNLGRMFKQLGAEQFVAVWQQLTGAACPEKLYQDIQAASLDQG